MPGPGYHEWDWLVWNTTTKKHFRLGLDLSRNGPGEMSGHNTWNSYIRIELASPETQPTLTIWGSKRKKMDVKITVWDNPIFHHLTLSYLRQIKNWFWCNTFIDTHFIYFNEIIYKYKSLFLLDISMVHVNTQQSVICRKHSKSHC